MGNTKIFLNKPKMAYSCNFSKMVRMQRLLKGIGAICNMADILTRDRLLEIARDR